ncbi:hypothetical protein ACH5RR_041472 [Cinchona calisaya]|uniref:Uncharacterized protein n=1 Tax=Cinchona calisaya TaxID=153742 RepID=A0ABD2XWX7_9GENT
MESKIDLNLLNMACFMVFSFIYVVSFSQAVSQETEAVHLKEIPASDTVKQKNLETYIVHLSLPVGVSSAQLEDLENWYHSYLPKTTTGFNDASRIVYSYLNVVAGFAARLSPEEVKEMEKKEGFVYARPQKILALHTTHSPNFLGLHKNFGFWPDSGYGKGVIVGVLDTGITPGHPSFNDEGLSPPPAKWKGKCELKGAACNNKLIGARNFVSNVPGLPVDVEGHGTHTASTAAGNFVQDANVFGNANGTAVGMAPHAHLAIYKVCSENGCAESDMLAAIDTAVEEGVDVLSLSIGAGGGNPIPFFNDGIAIGAFGAIQKGVFVSCSAGNSGPESASVSNEAPWILTVGASTTDRNIRATAVLENNSEFDGESPFQPKNFTNRLLPLVYAGEVSGDQSASLCAPESLDNADVRGKVVLCERGGGIGRINKGQTVKDAGGAAMILMNEETDGYSTLVDAHVLPATHVSFAAGQAIKAYINSTSTPTASILFRGTVIGVKDAPVVASFSSRGPSLASPGTLKPDIIGPGVSILAAWPISVENNTNTKSTFNVISGTSMSCPHLSGIAALLRSAHPDWSPAAIKSAIMTTANFLNVNNGLILDERKLPADVFAVGAGHVNPSKATNPGLVYDIQPDDYIPYLCGLGYTDKQIAIIVPRHVTCATISSIPEAQLNYPSFSIQLGSTNKTYTRTVTNVGKATSAYHFDIGLIPGVDVHVHPTTLNFTEVKQQKTYQVSFGRSDTSISNTYVQGAIKWVSNEHTVRSPISIELI